MKKWYYVELGHDLAIALRVWLKAHGISYETSDCGTLELPRTHFAMYMDEETSEICQNFLDEI